MSDPVTHNINASVQKTYEWIIDVERELHDDNRQRAYHALRSVMHALRDRLPVEEAAHLPAELPSVLRGVYYEGWSPAHKPEKLDRRAFLERVEKESAAPGNSDPLRSTRAVFSVLRQRLADGEIADVRSILPADYQDFWEPAS